MNIIDYAKKYGDKTIEEKEFNELDYLILACISYVDFSNIVSTSTNKITIHEAGRTFFIKFNKKEIKKNVLGVQAGIEVFEAIYELPRYKNLLLYNYRYMGTNKEQFSGLFIDITNNLTYIAFEGTDDLIVGWKEDAEMSYKFPIASHRHAIHYLNSKINPFSKKTYILGGHSKGGNLALVSSMYASSIVRNKIKHVYNFDGPGLKEKQFNSRFYRRISNKYTLVVPSYSIIGILLKHPEEMKVVASDYVGLLAHNALTWEINDSEFVNDELSRFSRKLDEIIIYWLKNYKEEERKEFVNDLFNIFRRANITSIKDIKSQALPNILSIIKESQGLSKKSRTMLTKLVRFMFDNIKIIAGDAIKHSIQPKKH